MSKAEGHASIATRATFLFIHRCSSNNSRGHSLFPGAIIPREKTIIRGRRLFQILLTGSRALNILFYYPIKSKKYHVKYNYTEHDEWGRICVTPRQIHDYLGSFPAGGTIQL